MTDYDKLLSRMDIEIRSVQLADPLMLAVVLGRVARYYYDCASKITITCREPERDGSTMYMMHVTYLSGGSISIGALRREPGAMIEFHS